MYATARRLAWSVVVAISLGTLWATPARAQGGGFNINPAQIRQSILGRYQDQIGFTDDEWKVVEPKLWNVLALQVQSGGGAIGSMIGGLRGRGGGGGGGAIDTFIAQIFSNGQPSQVSIKSQELQRALDDAGSSPSLIKVRLEEYRAAVTRTREQLKLAQADLQSVLTLRQEAALLAVGMLD